MQHLPFNLESTVMEIFNKFALQENSQLPTAKTIFRQPRRKIFNFRRPRTQPSEVIYLPTASDRAVEIYLTSDGHRQSRRKLSNFRRKKGGPSEVEGHRYPRRARVLSTLFSFPRFSPASCAASCAAAP
jgi:hypothetical protein